MGRESRRPFETRREGMHGMESGMRFVLLLVLAAGAGAAAQRFSFPLPWMIGPMLLAGTIGIVRGAPPVHWTYRPIGQVVVATAVGLAFTREAVAEVATHGGLMVAGAFLTIAAGYLAALLLVRLAHTDGTTAFFASMPGGPVEMASMAERFGVPGGPVALAQTLRIAGIVLCVAPLLLWSHGALRGPVPRFDGALSLKGLLLLYAIAVTAALLFKRLNLSNAFFLGPVAATAALTASGVTLSTVPFPLLVAGQVLLGLSLGARLDRNQLAGAGGYILAAFASTALLLALCFLIAAALAHLSGSHLSALVVSTAPGSVTEMALTARALHEPMAMVTAYHLVRIFILIPLASPLYRLFRWLAGNRVRFAPMPA